MKGLSHQTKDQMLPLHQQSNKKQTNYELKPGKRARGQKELCSHEICCSVNARKFRKYRSEGGGKKTQYPNAACVRFSEVGYQIGHRNQTAQSHLKGAMCKTHVNVVA